MTQVQLDPADCPQHEETPAAEPEDGGGGGGEGGEEGGGGVKSSDEGDATIRCGDIIAFYHCDEQRHLAAEWEPHSPQDDVRFLEQHSDRASPNALWMIQTPNPVKKRSFNQLMLALCVVDLPAACVSWLSKETKK